MKLALAASEFINGNVNFNLAQIERALSSARGRAELVVFGESFLQGFDALSWDFSRDRFIAVPRDGELMHRVCELSAACGTDLILGYYELDEESERIFSSLAVIADGRLLYNYRRQSTGWKERIADSHYAEGDVSCEFIYRGKKLMLALCGDMWDLPERFETDGVLIWSIYVNFDYEQWSSLLPEYAAQAARASRHALMVNSVSKDPASLGGAFRFSSGHVEERTGFGAESMLFVEL